MAYLADTNIVMRRVLASDPLHSVVRSAVDTLLLRSETVWACPQNLIEFHALATRPTLANGLGLSTEAARAEANAIQSAFPLLPDLPEIYPQWCALIDAHGGTGRQAFDVRLVAVMLVHGVSHLLTMNPFHFRRFPEITVVEPVDVLSAP